MKITRVLNNNVLLAQEDGVALLLMGLSIGYKKKAGDLIDSNSIEKMFILKNPNTGTKLQEMITFIPEEYFRFCSDAVLYIKKKTKREFSDNLYILLTDHIYSAVQRYEQGLILENALLLETRKFYSQEFEIASEIIKRANEQFHVHMSDDEAAFITFHIVNTQMENDTSSIQQMTRLIQKILTLIKNKYHIEYHEDKLSYSRFVTHLKYFSQKVFTHKMDDLNDEDLFLIMKTKYPQEYEGAKDILELTEQEYGYQGSDMDALYLTIHIARIRNDK